MLEDISSTFKAHLYDRISSPLSGAFLFSWPAWNWKFLLVVLSDLTAPEKLAYITQNIYPTKESALLYGLTFPLITAIAFILLYPIPSLWAYKISQHHKKTFKTTQQKTEDDIPLPQEEAILLKKLLRESQRHYEEIISKNNSELASIKEIQAKEAESTTQLKEKIFQLQSEKNMNNERAELFSARAENLANSCRSLTLFLKSCLPEITGVNENHGLGKPIITSRKIDFIKNMSELEIKQTDGEKYIEKELNSYIQKHLLFINDPVRILAIGGLVLLITDTQTLQNCIIGHYTSTHENLATAPICRLLDDLNKATVTSQT